MASASPTSACDIAAAVRSGSSALEFVEATLARIKKLDAKLNSFTAVTAERARVKARAIDRARDDGDSLGPLAGVPFAVKNLFDVAGLRTLAGSKINRSLPKSKLDSTLIERLEAAGAILVGALNMGEYAYDFTGENVHYGPSRNPHDLKRMSGGSSGGCGSAVGGALVPLALGSDTNGSIRVPSSLCGTFGLKPTYGRLTRARTFPFVGSLDHLGPFARNTADLAIAYDAMQGPDTADPVCTARDPELVVAELGKGTERLRLAMAGGYFQRGLTSEAETALNRVAEALGVTQEIELPEAERARSAAFVITTTEAAALHLERLRTRAEDFDPAVRDRLLSGAMVPSAYIAVAQKFRRWYRDRILEVFQNVDAIIAPATPCPAPLIGQQTFVIDGVEMPVRPNLGLFTQPISFVGLPVTVVPIPLEPLPIGVQIIAAPWREDIALRIAAVLERAGVARAPAPRALDGMTNADQ